MNFIERPSPNFNARATDVRHAVVHYTGMQSRDEALQRLCDPEAKVSAHYLIDQEGAAFRLIAEEQRAWHAGVSYWRGVRDINSTSIGIELCNPGHDGGYRPFPSAQMTTLKELLSGIFARHGLSSDALLAHSDIAPSRKLDPGELFPWRDFAKSGFGLWPADAVPVAGHADLTGALRRLSEIGYAVPTTPEEGSDILNANCAATDVIKAFQRRYLPDQIDGRLDNLTAARISAVAVAYALHRPTA
ncbi:MAG: N-acetylmuramoyl-L-alanine amidase [Proteobacteria bacterium]|nr:N-acetylmuramoyl-L-alanine amidase [Pseudomonadota bacterium]